MFQFLTFYVFKNIVVAYLTIVAERRACVIAIMLLVMYLVHIDVRADHLIVG